MPDALPAPFDVFERTVTAWLRKHKLDTDTRVVSPEAWRARREEFGDKAAATIVTEGPFNHLLNGHYPDAENDRLLKEFRRLVGRLGYRYEPGFSWTLHFYPMDPPAEGRRPTLDELFDDAVIDRRPRRLFLRTTADLLALAWERGARALLEAAGRAASGGVGADDVELLLGALGRAAEGEASTPGDGATRRQLAERLRAALLVERGASRGRTGAAPGLHQPLRAWAAEVERAGLVAEARDAEALYFFAQALTLAVWVAWAPPRGAPADTPTVVRRAREVAQTAADLLWVFGERELTWGVTAADAQAAAAVERALGRPRPPKAEGSTLGRFLRGC